MTARMMTYGAIADELAGLPAVALEIRNLRRLSVRAAASQIGVSFSTLSRFEVGKNVELSSVLAILRWLDGGAR